MCSCGCQPDRHASFDPYCGDDEHGKQMAAAYKARMKEVSDIINRRL